MTTSSCQELRTMWNHSVSIVLLAAPWLGNTLTHLNFDFERSLTNQYFTKPAGGLRGAALTLSYGQVNNDIGAPIYNLLSLWFRPALYKQYQQLISIVICRYNKKTIKKKINYEFITCIKIFSFLFFFYTFPMFWASSSDFEKLN